MVYHAAILIKGDTLVGVGCISDMIIAQGVTGCGWSVYRPRIYWMGLANFLLSESRNGQFIRIIVTYEILIMMAMEVADSCEILGYMMSHPRKADLRVMPLVILLKELNSSNAKENRTMRIE